MNNLPAVNALLNLASLSCLIVGRWAIARAERDLHRRAMSCAFIFSTAFLVSYLIYHYQAPQMTTFKGEGLIRIVYYTILFSHIPLATIVVPLAVIALYFAGRGKFASHRRVVRWLWPIWVYVSVTGISIYLLLYQLYY